MNRALRALPRDDGQRPHVRLNSEAGDQTNDGHFLGVLFAQGDREGRGFALTADILGIATIAVGAVSAYFTLRRPTHEVSTTGKLQVLPGGSAARSDQCITMASGHM